MFLTNLIRNALKTLAAKWNVDCSAVSLIVVFTGVLFLPLLFGYSYSMVGAHMNLLYPWTPVISSPPTAIIGQGYLQTDHAEWVYPTSVFVTEAVRNGEIPLWQPYTFGGLPALDYEMLGYRYPLRWPMFFLLSPIRQHDWLLLTHLLIAGLGMYALLRCWGAKSVGAAFGAIVWEMSGHSAFWLVFEHEPISLAWLPLSLLTATLATRRLSIPWAIAAGIAAGLFLLSGYLHYVYFGGILLICWYGGAVLAKAQRFLIEREYRKTIFCLLLPACSLIVALGVSSSLWMPLISGLGKVHRMPSSLELQLSESLIWQKILWAQLLPTSALPPANLIADWPSLGLIGIASLPLIAIALWRKRHISILFWFATLLASLGIVLGFVPLYRLLRVALPYFGTFHTHEGFFLFTFAAAVLAGFGFSELSDLVAAGQRRWWRWAVPCLLILALAHATLMAWAAKQKISASFSWWPIMAFSNTYVWLRTIYGFLLHQLGLNKVLVVFSTIAISALAPALLVWFVNRRGWFRAFVTSILAHRFLLMEWAVIPATALTLILFLWSTNPMHPVRTEYLFPVTPLIANLQALQKDWRVLPINQHMPPNEWRQPMLYAKTGVIFGLHSASGYENLLPEHVARIWWTVESKGVPNDVSLLSYRTHVHHDQLPIDLLEKLSVGVLATPPGVEPMDVSGRNLARDGTLKLSYRGTDGWIYENPNALHRAFLVPGIITVPDHLSALNMLADPKFDARKAVIISGESPPDYAEMSLNLSAGDQFQGRAEIERESLNEVQIRVEVSKSAMLVLNDSWDSEWKAYIEAVEQPITRANYAFRAVKVPAGKHLIVFRYRPRMVLIGLIVSISTFLSSLFLIGWFGIRSRARDREYISGNHPVLEPSPTADSGNNNIKKVSGWNMSKQNAKACGPGIMRAHNYEVLFDVEDDHWWFVGRRAIVFVQIEDILRAQRQDGAQRLTETTRPEMQILDVGCGTGATMDHLRKLGEVQGIDLAMIPLSFSRRRGHQRTMCASATELPFADETFDLVTALDVIEHLDDDVKGLSEIRRTLKSGAPAVIYVPAFKALWGPNDDQSGHKRRYRLPELQAAVEAAGLTIERISYSNFAMFLPIWLGRKLLNLLGRTEASENRINHPLINKLMAWMFSSEANWLLRHRLPFGVSIVCVARKTS